MSEHGFQTTTPQVSRDREHAGSVGILPSAFLLFSSSAVSGQHASCGACCIHLNPSVNLVDFEYIRDQFSTPIHTPRCPSAASLTHILLCFGPSQVSVTSVLTLSENCYPSGHCLGLQLQKGGSGLVLLWVGTRPAMHAPCF